MLKNYMPSEICNKDLISICYCNSKIAHCNKVFVSTKL